MSQAYATGVTGIRRLPTWQLFAICVVTWGTTWHAITYQVKYSAPEVGVAMRFGLAGVLVLAGCALRGVPLALGRLAHRRLALQGAFMFGLSYVCVYHAEKHLPSGLVAVGFSASPLVAGLGAWLCFGTPIGTRFLFGGLLGLAGVALIFWPEFGKAAGADTSRIVLGAAFTLASLLLSSVGSLAASRNRGNGLPFWPALGFGMVYGALTCTVIALAQGHRFAPPWVLSWWLSLVYLAVAGSILTFACWLTVQDRIGPGPSGTIGVMTPLLALVVSLAFEGYRPDPLTAVGVLLAVGGNVLMLTRRAPAASAVKGAAVAAE